MKEQLILSVNRSKIVLLSIMKQKAYLICCVCFLVTSFQITSAELKAPTDLRITKVSESHHSLEWKDTNQRETSYRIHRKQADGTWMWIGTVPSNTTTFECGGLNGNSHYKYRVQAMADDAEGPFSDVVSGFTLPWLDEQRGRVIEASTVRSDLPAIIRRKDGALVLYFSSFTGMHDKARSRIGKKISRDNGDSWSTMELFEDQPDWHLLNPSAVRMANDHILLTYAKMIPGTWTAKRIYRISEDEGETWTDEVQLTDDNYTYNTGSANKCYRLSNDRIIHLVHPGKVLNPDLNTEKEHYISKIFLGTDVFVSDDNANSWEKITKTPLASDEIAFDSSEFGFYEASLAEYEPGKLVMTARSQSGWMKISWSDDYGSTWSKPIDSGVRNGLSPPWIRKIGPGNRILLMYNSRFGVEEGWPFAPRWVLCSMISDDGGRTWHNYRHFEGDGKHWYQYPATYVEDGLVHVFYHKTTTSNPNGRPWELLELAYLRLDESWFGN